MSGTRLALRVVPGARETRWAGRLADGRWRVRVAAPAIEGRANDALVAFLARSLAVPRGAVRVVRGHGARDKWVTVDLDATELERRLQAAGEGGNAQ